MTLLNAAMALGTLAFVIPLAIHLLFRNRFRTIDWGAMFLLRDVVQANRRRMRWHHWILLLLRCAIPLLLALAMARPLISAGQFLSGRSLPGSQPLSLVLMIDDSRSMSAARRSSSLVGAADQILDSLSRTDEVIVMRSSELNSPVSTGSVQDARDQIRDLRFDGVCVPLDEMVAAAIGACSSTSHPYRRIVIGTDFQESLLADVSTDTMQSIADRLTTSDEVMPIELDFIDVAANEDAGSIGNVVVESVEVESSFVLEKQPARLSAVIRNDSDAAIASMRCVWAVGDKDLHTEMISMPPRSSAPIAWSHPFERSGETSVTLSVQHDDALMSDNRRRLAIEVMPPIRVWLIDGEPSSQPLQSETDFLKIALSPYAFQINRLGKSYDQNSNDGNLLRDLVSTKIFTSESFRRADPLWQTDPPDLLVFANVETLPELTSEKPSDAPVLSYLKRGGSVVLFDGDRVDASQWNSLGWLPAKLTPRIESASPGMRIEAPGSMYEPWSVLGGSDESLFDTVEVNRIRVWEPADDPATGNPAAGNPATVLLRTQSGQPIVVSRGVTIASPPTGEFTGEFTGGRVIQFAIPCDTAWSNLPLRPVFLPMIQQLVLDLAGKAHRLNGPPGSTFRLTRASDGTLWRVTLPDATALSVATQDSQPLSFSDTSQVGVYQFTAVADRQTESPDKAETPVQIRVVDVPASESVLRKITPQMQKRAVDRLGGRLFFDVQSWTNSASRARFGLEIWRPLLMLLLAVMVSEVLWQQLGSTRVKNVSRSTKPNRESAWGLTDG